MSCSRRALIVTFAATMIPTIKASRLDPAQALRPE
jgi:ABC-type lipoprotein release transport system permease subunit